MAGNQRNASRGCPVEIFHNISIAVTRIYKYQRWLGTRVLRVKIIFVAVEQTRVRMFHAVTQGSPGESTVIIYAQMQRIPLEALYSDQLLISSFVRGHELGCEAKQSAHFNQRTWRFGGALHQIYQHRFVCLGKAAPHIARRGITVFHMRFSDAQEFATHAPGFGESVLRRCSSGRHVQNSIACEQLRQFPSTQSSGEAQTTTRLRPSAFARYIAWSAALMSSCRLRV